jgi:hypothetical protein
LGWSTRNNTNDLGGLARHRNKLRTLGPALPVSPFQDEYPEDNERFNNVVYTDEIEKDREKSLLAMRERMFPNTSSKRQFSLGVWAGLYRNMKCFDACNRTLQ